MLWYSFTRPPHYLHSNWLVVWSLIHKMIKSRFCWNPRIQDNWMMFLPPTNNSLDLQKRCIRTFAHWFELQFWFEWKILSLLEVTSNWSCIKNDQIRILNTDHQDLKVEFQISTHNQSLLYYVRYFSKVLETEKIVLKFLKDTENWGNDDSLDRKSQS